MNAKVQDLRPGDYLGHGIYVRSTPSPRADLGGYTLEVEITPFASFEIERDADAASVMCYDANGKRVLS